jgi:hypothetical protein
MAEFNISATRAREAWKEAVYFASVFSFVSLSHFSAAWFKHSAIKQNSIWHPPTEIKDSMMPFLHMDLPNYKAALSHTVLLKIPLTSLTEPFNSMLENIIRQFHRLWKNRVDYHM